GPDAPYTSLLFSMITISERPKAEREAWRALFDHYVFREHGHPLAHLPADRRGVPMLLYGICWEGSLVNQFIGCLAISALIRSSLTPPSCSEILLHRPCKRPGKLVPASRLPSLAGGHMAAELCARMASRCALRGKVSV